MAIDRVELIMQAVECNKVQAMIYEDEIKDIPDSRLMDFFKFRPFNTLDFSKRA